MLKGSDKTFSHNMTSDRLPGVILDLYASRRCFDSNSFVYSKVTEVINIAYDLRDEWLNRRLGSRKETKAIVVGLS